MRNRSLTKLSLTLKFRREHPRYGRDDPAAQADILVRLATQLKTELEKRQENINASKGRFPKSELFRALNGCRGILANEFGGPVTARCSIKRSKPSDTLILEYLLDYGICRCSIPQAIRQPKQNFPELSAGQQYKILLAVESELGNDEEVARDFLKLLDVRSRVKCLVFRRRPTDAKAKLLYDRLDWVMSHHKWFNPEDPILLVALPNAKSATLADDILFQRVLNGHAGADL